jgi:septal ring factor EnvC (AmiA/AmiB activator)
MEENLRDLQAELAALEEEEAQISAERRHLHSQIDFGYASEATRAREREVSDRRRELHARIDALRESLGMQAGPKRTSTEAGLDQVSGGIGELERIVDPTQRIGAPADDSSIL